MYIALQFTVIIISLSKCLHVMIQQFEHENLNIKAAFLTMYSWNMKWARTNYNSTCDGDWMCSQRGIHVVCQFMRPTIRCHIRAFRLISWQSEAYRRESRGRATASCVAYWYLTSHVTSPHAAVGVQLARYLGTDRQTDRQTGLTDSSHLYMRNEEHSAPQTRFHIRQIFDRVNRKMS